MCPADVPSPGTVRRLAWREGRVTLAVAEGAGPGDAGFAAGSTPAEGAYVAPAGTLLLPGFVDCHTHFLFAGDRADEFGQRLTGVSYQAIAAAGGGIRKTMRATRAASNAELAANLERHLDRALLDGTTTVEVKVSYGLDLEHDLRGLEVVRDVAARHPVRVVPTWMGAHEIPDEFRGDREAWMRRLCDGAVAVARQGIARYADVFCEEGVFTPDESRRILLAAREAGLGLKIHADEFGPSGGSDVAAELGVTSADHLHGLPARNIEKLKGAGVVPVALPGTAFFLRLAAQAPVRALLDAGLPVAIASDGNPGSNMTESMPFMLTLACLQYGITPREAFDAATTNAARALDRGPGTADEVGRLAPGAFADFQVVRAPSIDHLAYHYGRSHVAEVWVGGRKVVEDGRRLA